MNEILLMSYWEHYKQAKDLAMYLDVSHPKRVKIEEELNVLIEKLGYEKDNNNL